MFAHRQSGIENLEVYVRVMMTGSLSNTVYNYVSTVMDGSFSHALRTNNLFKFEYVVNVTRVRLLDVTPLKIVETP